MADSIFPEAAALEFRPVAADTELYLGRRYEFDYLSGEFVTDDGRIRSAADTKALKDWIEKIIRTEKFSWRVYDRGGKQDEYGVSIMNLVVGRIYPLDYLSAEIKREITAACKRHPDIDYLSDWVIEKRGTLLYIEFAVHTRSAEAALKISWEVAA